MPYVGFDRVLMRSWWSQITVIISGETVRSRKRRSWMGCRRCGWDDVVAGSHAAEVSWSSYSRRQCAAFALPTLGFPLIFVICALAGQACGAVQSARGAAHHRHLRRR